MHVPKFMSNLKVKKSVQYFDLAQMGLKVTYWPQKKKQSSKLAQVNLRLACWINCKLCTDQYAA